MHRSRLQRIADSSSRLPRLPQRTKITMRRVASCMLSVVAAFQVPRSRVAPRTPITYAAKTLPAEVVFENINFFGFVKRLTAAVAHARPETLTKITKALPADDFIAVVSFYILLDPALRLMWRIRSKRSFGDSWFGTLRPALKLLSSVFACLYGLDVLYCTSCLVGNPLPNVIPAVAAGIGYTAVAGTLCTSIKDRFLERQVLPAWSKDTRARNFAVKRGTGIGIWILCILICLETLRIEAGVSVKSIIGLTSIFGIATGFAVKDLASNWVGGLLLFVTRPFVPGDKIEMSPPVRKSNFGRPTPSHRRSYGSTSRRMWGTRNLISTQLITRDEGPRHE